MDNTQNSIVYAVNSDLDDGILYAEFETEDAAIEYAKRNLDKLPFVDELKVSRDANGEVDDVFEYKTIWDHTMVEEPEEETEDDYWDELETMYDDSEKHVIGDTTWFESVDTDELVETLEENEDTVECKECFDLFPKANCIKVDFGYICPTCAEGGTVSEEDLFKMDFPEYEKMSVGNDMIPDEPMIPAESSEEVPPVEAEDEIDPISTPEEAVPFLVKDEEEAIAGYEKAAEVVADSDLENKDEILEVIDHIKEEEEEHIEELIELVDTEEEEVSENENDPVSEEEVEETEDSDEEGQTFEALEESAALAGIAASAASGVLVDVVRRIIDKIGSYKKESKWIDYKKYVIEKTPDKKINIWDINGKQIFSDLKTVKAAKQKIKTLPKPSKKNPAPVKPEGEAEPVEEAMSDFQRGLIDKLTPVTKDEFQKKLESGEPEIIFTGDPRETGIRGRTYEVIYEDGKYVVFFWDETYNEDFTDSEVAEEFDNIDDLWTYMVNFMEDEDFSPEYNYLTEQLTEESPVVVSHSKDDLPIDSCDHEMLTEATTDELSEIFKLCREIGLKTGGDLKKFIEQNVAPGESLLTSLRSYNTKNNDN